MAESSGALIALVHQEGARRGRMDFMKRLLLLIAILFVTVLANSNCDIRSAGARSWSLLVNRKPNPKTILETKRLSAPRRARFVKIYVAPHQTAAYGTDIARMIDRGESTMEGRRKHD
jgi:hypothetical protein